MIIFSGTSNEPLAQNIANELQISLGKREIARFSDGEIRPWIQESVRDKTVFVVQSFSQPLSEYIMECILIADAIKRGAPKRMVGVIPYFGYARQDKQHRIGEPVSARVIAKLLEVVPFHEIITMDLHNDAIVGFFRIPVVHLTALTLIANYLQSKQLEHVCIVSPDVGGVKRARNLALMLNVPIVVMEKKRNLNNTDESETYQIIGDVEGKHAVIIDDIISTGGTIVHSVDSLLKAGVSKVTVCATHGILSGEAKYNLSHAPIEEVIITDTINHPELLDDNKFRILPVASVFAESIRTITQTA